MIRCQSKIVKEFKTRKPQSCYPKVMGPNNSLVDNPDGIGKETCGGEVTITVKAVDEPDYVSDHYAVLEVEVTCERCGWPYFDGMHDLRTNAEKMLSAIAMQHYANETA